MGERWEYVGTVRGYHEFRLKSHPQVDDRLYARVSVNGGGLVWSGNPYYEEGHEISLRKDCQLKALFRAEGG